MTVIVYYPAMTPEDLYRADRLRRRLEQQRRESPLREDVTARILRRLDDCFLRGNC